MKRKKDRSILYGALAGFILLALVFIIYDISLPWYECSDFERYFSFPEGTPYHRTDTHGGFHADGVTILVAQIPLESSQDFVQVLRGRGFSDSPLPEDIRREISNYHEISGATNISNGLWWFQDESPTGHDGRFTDYAFHIYDLDTLIYYYIESNF